MSQQPEYEDPYKALVQETATPSPILCVLGRARAALMACAATDRAGSRNLAGVSIGQ